MADQRIFVVTDIETDGPWPGPNSMRSLASVAVSADGVEHGTFEAVLERLPGATPNPDTLAWFTTQPEAWAAATTHPEPILDVMHRFVDWVQQLPGDAVFCAKPLAFDGGWVDYYLRRFTRFGVCQGPYETVRLFTGPGVCLESTLMAATGEFREAIAHHDIPASWLGNVPHTHRAIDDARGYANLLVHLLRGCEAAPSLRLEG